jgi:hypothetical protein
MFELLGLLVIKGGGLIQPRKGGIMDYPTSAWWEECGQLYSIGLRLEFSLVIKLVVDYVIIIFVLCLLSLSCL